MYFYTLLKFHNPFFLTIKFIFLQLKNIFFPSRLRGKFLLVALILFSVVSIQAIISIFISYQSQSDLTQTTSIVDHTVADLELSVTLKSMQVQVLLIQNLIATLSVTEPAERANSMRGITNSFINSLNGLEKATQSGQLATLGGIKSFPDQLYGIRTTFNNLRETTAQTLTAEGATPPTPATILKISATVDGLFEQLDRVSEALKLRAAQNRTLVSSSHAVSEQLVGTVRTTIFATGGIGLLICLFTSIFLFRSILYPLIALTKLTTRLADGDHDTRLPLNRSDELGDLVNSLEIFRRNGVMVQQINIERAAEKQRQEHEKRIAMAATAERFRAMAGSIVSSVADSANDLVKAARSLADQTAHAHHDALTVHEAAKIATDDINRVLISTQQLKTDASRINEQVEQAATVTRIAAQEAETTRSLTMRLTDTAVEINHVVSLIQQIAGKTNLLALNATIEAARAAEYGRGFAVVAVEVKALARQTSEATEAISKQISAIQNAVDSTVAAMHIVTNSIAAIDAANYSVSGVIRHQAETTDEIATLMAHTAAGIGIVGQNIAAVSQSVDQADSVSAHVFSASHQLSSQAIALKEAVAEFLSEIEIS